MILDGTDRFLALLEMTSESHYFFKTSYYVMMAITTTLTLSAPRSARNLRTESTQTFKKFTSAVRDAGSSPA